MTQPTNESYFRTISLELLKLPSRKSGKPSTTHGNVLYNHSKGSCTKKLFLLNQQVISVPSFLLSIFPDTNSNWISQPPQWIQNNHGNSLEGLGRHTKRWVFESTVSNQIFSVTTESCLADRSWSSTPTQYLCQSILNFCQSIQTSCMTTPGQEEWPGRQILYFSRGQVNLAENITPEEQT